MRRVITDMGTRRGTDAHGGRDTSLWALDTLRNREPTPPVSSHENIRVFERSEECPELSTMRRWRTKLGRMDASVRSTRARTTAAVSGLTERFPGPSKTWMFSSEAPGTDSRRSRKALRETGHGRLATIAAGCLLFATLTSHATAASLLHEIFQDHAVLQRDHPVRLWGTTSANDEVRVSFANHSLTARADAAGEWTATLPSMPAGGPYTLTARSGEQTQTVNDVLVGDVWLCSGQSNMVVQVHRALDSRSEIANSANDTIRMVTIANAVSPKPLRSFQSPVEWQVAQPKTVPEFSATCYYFARELQKTTRAPMGLITAAWGGAKIEAWMSEGALRAAGQYDAALDVLKLYATDQDAAAVRWGEMWQSWWQRTPSTRGITDPWLVKPNASQWRDAPPALGPWEHWGVPELAAYNGMVWYRTTVSLTAGQAKQRARLSIGRVDEVDQTWVNGKAVGNTRGFNGEEPSGPDRIYLLPAGTLEAGENVIVVNVLDTYATGGLVGPASSRALHLADGTTIPLDRPWRYQIAPKDIGTALRAPWESVAGLGTIHNAMIAPLDRYTIRGAAWYQGESNTEEASRYESLLRGLIADWRNKFGADLPFLIVQLANYGAPPTTSVESGWAELREAQRRVAAADPRAGLAVTIDIGDRYDIHPANKQEVGRRPARAARHVVYGESAPASGPVAARAVRDGDQVIVTFTDVTNRLVAYSATEPVGFELCGATRNSCRFTRAALEGNRAILSPAGASATRVRFCWADSPVCTLFDGSGLPAGPFEMTIDAPAASE